MKYLNGIKTFDELGKAYRKWAIKLHPDNGGSKEEMQILNAECEAVLAKVKNIRTTASGKTYTQNPTETPEMFKPIINKIIGLDGIEIEICGSWVWVTGNTYSCKDTLKAAGFRWANNKKAWYWHTYEEASHNRKKMTLDEIRTLHGCTKVKGNAPKKLSAVIKITAATI